MKRPENRKRQWAVWQVSTRSLHTSLLLFTLCIGLLYLLLPTHLLDPSLPSFPLILLREARMSLSVNNALANGSAENFVPEHHLEWRGAAHPRAGLGLQSNSVDSFSAQKGSDKISGVKTNTKASQQSVKHLDKEDDIDVLENSSSKERKPSGSKNSPHLHKSSIPSVKVNMTQISLQEPVSVRTLRRICGDGEGRSAHRLDLVIMVLSHVQGFQHRQALRDTWLSPFRRSSSPIRHFFILGQDPTLSQDAVHQLHHEMNTHQDVLQASLNDSYDHLTYKTLLGFSLIATGCRHARHVLKTDHDVWVNMPSLVTYLSHFPFQPPEGIGGFCRGWRTPIRYPQSKYYISKELYPNDTYPAYCNGPGYVTTPEVVRQIVAVSSHIPYFRLEDVYVALCLHTLQLRVRHVQGFAIWRGVTFSKALSPQLCRYHDDSVFLRHDFSPQQLRQIWAAGKCHNHGGPTRKQA